MKDFIKAMDDLPLILKIILALPALDIVWGIYRIVKGVAYKNVVTLIFGILWIIPGSVICWILDIVTLLLNNKLLFA
jgi:hypothetical protein